MDHIEHQHDVAPYVAGRLDDVARHRFELHLVGCRECRDLVAGCEGVAAGASNASDPLAGHPDPLTLKLFVEGPHGAQAEDVAAHVEQCLSCGLETERWKQQQAERQSPPSAAHSAMSPVARMRWDPRVLAAGAALGAFCMFGVASLWTRQAAPAPQTGGVAEWIVLAPPTRGDVELRRVRPVAGQAILPLGVSLVLPASVADSDRVRVAVADASGRTVWRQELSAGDLRSAMRSNGILLVQVPLDDLGRGRHALSVTTRSASIPSVLEVPFEILP